MFSYFERFPEKSRTELRTVTFLDDSRESQIPVGTYLFTEYYCTDPACDCQRVLVKVLRVASEGARHEDVATLSYTWDLDSDDEWSVVNREMSNPFLDPLHPKTKYAAELLEFWSEMIGYDPAYVERLERHYHELRAAPPLAPVTTWTRSGRHSNAPPKAAAAPVLTKHERRVRQRQLEQVKRNRKSR